MCAKRIPGGDPPQDDRTADGRPPSDTRIKKTPALPNGRLPETRPIADETVEELRARVRELETLCAEVYVAAVEIGLPQPLLNRLWTVAAHGSAPHTYQIELPPRAAPPGQGGSTAPTPSRPSDQMPLPDIRLTDRPQLPGTERSTATGPEARQPPALPELKPLPERRTVLVVDDDPMMLEVLVRILQRENYELLTAGSGPAALQIADAHERDIELLITDYMMPEMRGRELAEKMRERFRDLKVLYQTGFSDMLFEDRVELEEGAAFLEKPFSARGLREAARLVLYGEVNPQPKPEAT